MEDEDIDFGAGLLKGLSLDGSLGPELAEALAGVPLPEWPAEMPPDFPKLPPGALGGMPEGIFESLCKGMMADIHRCHSMSAEEKEERLRPLELRVPGRAGRSVRLLEDPDGAVAARATGTVLWPAAGALVEWLDRDEAPLLPPSPSASSATGKQKNAARRARQPLAVELGAGLGAVGLHLALHRDCDVILTDSEEVLPLLARNVREHFPSGGERARSGAGSAVAVPLNWGDKAQVNTVLTHGGGVGFDLVVGSDVTYRPECLSVLVDTAASLLRPGGRLVLALQDRVGEADALQEVLAKHSDFGETSRSEAPPAGIIAAREAASDKGPEGDSTELPRVWIYEAVRTGEAPAVASAQVAADASAWAATPASVEEEFRRLTGVDVEPLLPNGAWPERPAAKAADDKAEMQPAPRSEHFIKDLLGRGLGSYLCEMDDRLADHIATLPPEARPKTSEQKRRFAEEYYANGNSSQAVAADEPSAAHAAARAAALAEASPEEVAAAGIKPKEEAVPKPIAKAKMCLAGLDWRVDVCEADQQLTATVTFGEEVWSSLAYSGGAASFRDAVEFEMADSDFRVRHFGTSVLELRLHRAVDANRACAKISSRHRRVTVRAPLR